MNLLSGCFQVSASLQVFVGNDEQSHDLDGLGLAGFEDGSHFLQLKIGMAFDSRCLAMTDRNLGVWSLMAAPSIILSRDEYEIISSRVTFTVKPFTLQVPADAPALQLLRPQAESDIRLSEIHFRAQQNPFSWQARVIFADGRELLCGPAGWSLDGEPAEFRIDLEVKAKHMRSSKEHENTLPADEFLSGIRPEFPYLLARGQYSPDPNKSERCFLYYRASDHLVPVREAWLTPLEIDRALAHTNIVPGECDAMYIPAPVFVWSATGGGFSLYRNLKLFVRLLPEGLTIHRFPLAKKIFPRDTIKGIHAYLNRGWVECGLKLMLGERELTLVRAFEWAASADPTYDGLNLMADTAWAVSLGQALSKSIGCPYVADKDLQ
ncbi:MAG: hypothetical protein JNJ69_15050 [Leptospiraceae bacterium]|nr:hypothetical protein [Leptospiraceae bacterium]